MPRCSAGDSSCVTVVSVRSLGRFEVFVGGGVVPADAWRQRRAAELVKILSLARGQRLHREQIIDAPWPALAPKAGAANLHKAAHHARRALGSPEGIVLRGEQVALWPDATVEVDALRFEDDAAQAFGSGDPDACARVAETYGGELLLEDRYAVWVQDARGRLRHLYLQLLRRAGLWERVIDEEPMDEVAHRALMRARPPPALDSVRYARDFEEVRLYGGKNGSLRTIEQTETARFWTELVQQQHTRTLRNLVTRLGLNLREAARALALGTTIMADSLIACWDAKLAYGYWRPVTAISAGDTDDNRRTAADPAWEPLAPTPNHPEYPSAHTCVTTGLAVAAAALVGGDRIDLDVASTVTGTTRHFTHVNDLVRDIQYARVYIGYHWRNSGEVGSRLAERVARWSLEHYFRPTE